MNQENKKANKVLGAAIWAYGDKIAAQLLSTVISVILARIIAPEAYGVVAVAMIFINFLDVFVDPGLNSSLVRKKNPDNTDFSTMFFFNILVGLLIYFILYISAPLIEKFWNVAGLAEIVRVMALKIPLVSVFSIQRVFVQKKLLYKKFFLVSTVGTLTSAVAAIAMVYCGFGVWALAFNTVIKSFCDMLLSFVFIPWKPQFCFSGKALREHFGFGKNMLMSKIVDVAYVELSGIAMGKKYSATDLAHYNKGRKFPQMVVTTINSAVGEVLFSTLSDIQDDADRLKKVLRKSVKVSNYVLFPMMVGFLACSESFIGMLLTEKWLPCVPYLRIMCLYYLCLPTSNAIYQGIKALGNSRTIFAIESIKKGIGLAFIILTLILFGDPISIAYSILLTMIISTVIDLLVARKQLNYSFAEFLADIGKTALMCLIMFALVFSVEALGLGYLLTLALQIVLGVVLYVVLSKLLKVEEFSFLLTLLKKKMNLRR